MSKIKILLITLLSVIILVGCSKNESTKSDEGNVDNTISKNEVIEETVLYQNHPKNIEQGGKIAKYSDTYYYSEIKDKGKLYSKSATKDIEPVKINDDIVGYINIYKDKLYYINYSNEAKTELVTLDINDTSKREVIDENLMNILIKDDKLIAAHRGKDGEGMKSGFSYIDVVVTDLKTNEIIDEYDGGYGDIDFVDESTYISFSTSTGNFLVDSKGGIVFPTEIKSPYYMTYLDTHPKGTLLNVDDGIGYIIPGIYLVYDDGMYTTLAGADDTTDISDDEIIVNAVSIEDDLFYFTKEFLGLWDFRSNEGTKINDYKLENTDRVYKFDKDIIILSETGEWEILNSDKLKEEAKHNKDNQETQEIDENEEVVETESKLATISDENIKSQYNDFVINIYGKYYDERDYSDKISKGGIEYAALKSPYETKEKLIRSIESYFTDEFLKELRNKNDMIVENSKEYLAISENEYSGISSMETIKSKEYKDGVLRVGFTSDWGGTLFDCVVEFIDVNGITKINKIKY